MIMISETAVQDARVHSEVARAAGGLLRGGDLTLQDRWDRQGATVEKPSPWGLGELCVGVLRRPMVDAKVGEFVWEQITEGPLCRAQIHGGLRLWAMGKILFCVFLRFSFYVFLKASECCREGHLQMEFQAGVLNRKAGGKKTKDWLPLY